MNEFSTENLSATFHYGEKEFLTPLWHDKNVICPNNKLYYVLDGEIVLKIDGKIYLGKSGDMFLIPAGVKHDFHLSESMYAVKYWFHFDLKSGAHNYFETFNLPYKIHVGLDDYLIELFEKMTRSARGEKPSDKLICTSVIFALVSYYMERCVYTENKDTTDEIDKVITHVKNNYGENFSLEELAKFVNLSPNYFVKKFKNRTGHPPLQFIKMIKLERAKFLLEQSFESVSAIMEQTGFFDSAHFSKMFKLRYGHSPRKYREIYNYNKKKA